MIEDKKTYKRILLAFVVILSIYGAYCGGYKHRNLEDTRKNSELLNNNKSIPADSLSFDNSNGNIENIDDNQSKISYDNFLNIKMGMSFEEVKNILGNGKEISSSETEGIKTSIYEYEGKGISSITITTQNNCVTCKTQLNLKPNKNKISLEDYNKINNGMSYENVKEVIGEGQLTTESSIMGSSSAIYSYINPDGSNAYFTFDNNMLKIKTQYNLK